jgi:hypothetical protein
VFLDLVEMLRWIGLVFERKGMTRNWSYQDDSPESGIVGIGQAVDKGVQRVSALDVIVEA